MVSVADFENCLTVKLRNDGTGPLIVRSLQVRRDKAFKETLIYWMPTLRDGVDWTTFVGPVTKRSIPPSSEFTLNRSP